MKKKLGFTLAEVLITLGIIGVVAALTAPALVQNAGTAKVGPTLAKVVSTIETANEQLLADENITDLSKVAPSREEYYEILSKYISGSSYDNDKGVTFTPTSQYYNGYYNTPSCLETEGHNYPFYFSENITLFMYISKVHVEKKGSFKGYYMDLYVDINGPNVKPNMIGKDIFLFIVDKGGAVIPAGSKTCQWLMGDDAYYENSDYGSSNKGEYACNKDVVTTGFGCSGAIFDNNLKVIYQ